MSPVLTTTTGTNADLLPEVFKIYAKDGFRILDMTYGKGAFWKKIDKSKYIVVENDIEPSRGSWHEDFRNTHWDNEQFDIVILDPPYVFGAGGTDSVMDEQYKNGLYRQDETQKGVSSIISLYSGGMKEAKRILTKNGLLMVKCMDLISGGKQHRIHMNLYNIAIVSMGMLDEDLFIFQQSGTPVMRHNYQIHARKNNSFLWIFRKS